MDTNEKPQVLLPALEDDFLLEYDQTKSFQEDGHILLRGVASEEEVHVYEPFISGLVDQLHHQVKPLHERDTYGKAFIQMANLWKKSQTVRKFVLAKRFAKVAAGLMGVSGVRIYHDQALYKEPGGGHTPWHQDQIYWPLNTDKTITMWMPLVPISEEMGSMTFASKSHHYGYINKMVISDESHTTLQDFIQAKGFEKVTYGSMRPGDATFHTGWTLHSAPGNPTEHLRKVMTIIYFADGTPVAEPDSNARKNDLKKWLPGLNAGDLAVSPLNPLVYSNKV